MIKTKRKNDQRFLKKDFKKKMKTKTIPSKI